MQGLFKRINFFKGLFMKVEDWRKEQEYHMEKQRFHNKYLHTPGVIMDCLESLKVTVTENNTKLRIGAGYAIDGEGRDLYVPEVKEVFLPDLQTLRLPGTYYISIRYTENLTDRRDVTANPEYSGSASVAEDTIIEVTNVEPDNKENIELGRVSLTAHATHVRNAPESGISGPDEIDYSHVPAAGAMNRAELTSLALSDISDKLIDTKVVVIAGTRKQEDTNILIEQYPKDKTEPMYLVFTQSLDGARTRWSIECSDNDQGTLDYTLHIRNESNRTTTVMCRVFRLRG